MALVSTLAFVGGCKNDKPTEPGSGASGQTTSAPSNPARDNTLSFRFRDSKAPVEERIQDLLGQLTLAEKVSQLGHDAPAIERFGIPAYNWWNEAPHGVAGNGRATVFPQTIGLAATFDAPLALRVATAISDEARAKFNVSQKIGNTGRFAGLTFWAPHINILRDPRWARGQETYGEDPYLTRLMGTLFVRGLQGDDPQHLKTAACAKSFAVHSGPERNAQAFDARPSRKDLFETYLPAFESLVREAGVEAIMTAGGSVGGVPVSANAFLLNDVLRDRWGFKGPVVSPCGALQGLSRSQQAGPDAPAAAALALNAGLDLNCGEMFQQTLVRAVESGLVDERSVDRALFRLLRTRLKLGLFDPPDASPWAGLGEETVGSETHRALAKEAAHKSIVLLKNNGVLPLRKELRAVRLLGPYVSNGRLLLGSNHGTPAHLSTLLEGVARRVSAGTRLYQGHAVFPASAKAHPSQAFTKSAAEADAIVVTLGWSQHRGGEARAARLNLEKADEADEVIAPKAGEEGEEGEEGDASQSIGPATTGDKADLTLPANQLAWLRSLKAHNTAPIIAVVFGGSAPAISEVHELADAVLMAWHPGQEGGEALADILFGDVSPSGRLPLTVPKSVHDLPPFEDYRMAGRTYRYMDWEPLYPFGFGLSYSSFAYSDLRLPREGVRAGHDLPLSVRVKNEGPRAAEEVVQVYLKDEQASVATPNWALRGFARVSLQPGESQVLSLMVRADDMKIVTAKGDAIFEPGHFRVAVGGSLPHPRSLKLGATQPVRGEFMLHPESYVNPQPQLDADVADNSTSRENPTADAAAHDAN